MEIVNYVDPSGREPFRDWVRHLDVPARFRVSLTLDRLRSGNLASLKSVGGGVLESRIDWGPGLRLYLGRRGDTLIVLLGGGTKSGQRTDIQAAKARWTDYKARAKKTDD